MRNKRKNSLFVKHYDRVMNPLEKRKFKEIRTGLLAKARGHVLEIGSGTGLNFSLYRDVHVTALEPNEAFRSISLARVIQAEVTIEVVEGNAEALPFPDQTFDTVVGTLVFCSIADPVKAIQEMRRVCKPSASILLFEHVRHDSKTLAFMQDIMTPVWKRIGDNCHLNRDTEQLLLQEGLKIKSKQTYFGRVFIVMEAYRP